ncbi:MAG: hypothetical protein WA110_09160 [Anaerolineaceae bacterium]
MKKETVNDEPEAKGLADFEKQLQDQIQPIMPNTFFKNSLKDRLAQSNVFQRRKEVGAWLVFWFSVAMLGMVVIGVLRLICGQRGCKGGKA